MPGKMHARHATLHCPQRAPRRRRQPGSGPIPAAPTCPAALLVWPLQHALPPVAVGVGARLQEGQQTVQILQTPGQGSARDAPARGEWRKQRSSRVA